MKSLYVLVLFLILFLFNTDVQAMTGDLPTVKFGGNKYSLLYSVKNNDTNGYLNEYYKQREGYTNWTELIAVHHYPNVNSYIENANAVQKYLSEKNCSPHLSFDEKKGIAIIDFFMIHDTNSRTILEYNVFKYEKDTISGIIAFQYVKRFYFSNGLEAEMQKRDLQKSRKKYVNKVANTELPKLIVCEIENGRYIVKTSIDGEQASVTKTVDNNIGEQKQDNYSKADYYPCDEFFRYELKFNINEENMKNQTTELTDTQNTNKDPKQIINEYDDDYSKSDYYPCDAFFKNLD